MAETAGGASRQPSASAAGPVGRRTHPRPLTSVADPPGRPPGSRTRSAAHLGHAPAQPYMRRMAKSTICSTAFASNTMRCSPSMSRTKP